MSEDIGAMRQRLEEHGQGHLLDFYDELSEGEQKSLLAQLSALDFDRLEALTEQFVFNRPAVELPGDIEPPDIIPAGGGPDGPAAAERGRQVLAAGRVAAFVVAGGQGTRLGFDGPKGCFPATPLKRKPLFQVFAEQILAARRTYGAPIPWYVMTSPVNHDDTTRFFEEHACWGLDPDDVMLFVQGTMPAIDYRGKLMLAEKGQLAVSPDGHGGSLAALARSGALDDMARRGVDTISYFQVDNPLVRCLDPLFIGLHGAAGAEMSAKALPKRDPREKLGNFCVANGNVVVIEYSDMPADLAEQRDRSGNLRFSAGSIAIHLLDRAFVGRLTAGAGPGLPFHRADKKVPHVDRDGRRVNPEEPNAVKLERFVFDAMPLAGRCVLLETRRAEEFSPIKNSEGIDSPTGSRRDQIRRAAAWLEAAGVDVPRRPDGEVDAVIEISPLFADSAAELAGRLEGVLSIKPGQELYLGQTS